MLVIFTASLVVMDNRIFNIWVIDTRILIRVIIESSKWGK